MDHSLVAFALVAEEYERSGDPVKGLAPLFKAVLANQAGQLFDPCAFSGSFSERFGFFMPAHVARGLAERLAELGFLTEQGAGKFIVAEDLKGLRGDFEETRLLATADLFSEWATAEIDRLGVEWEAPNLQEALFTRLARPEFASVFTEQAAPRSSDRVKGLLGRAAVSRKVDQTAILDYLVARFVLDTRRNSPEVFEELNAIAFGALIADAVAGLSVPGIAKMPDPPLRVIIDGPLLLDYLNLNTDERYEYAQGLFRLMREANLKLATFDHVVDEVRNTIKAALREFRGGTEYGPLGERLRKTSGFATYATHMLDTLEQRLEKEDVAVLRFEVYERQDFKNYFNDGKIDTLRNALGDVHLNLERRIRDTNSVAGVARLKKENRRAPSIFQAGTTFLTRNSALYSRVQRALCVGKEEPDPRFTIVTDSQLCGVLWFSLGSADQVELTKQRLIANCAAAVLPQREVVQRITKFLDGLDPALAQEFSVLMRDERASLCPMRLTAGQADLVTPDLAKKALEVMREELAAPIVERASLAQLSHEYERTRLVNEIAQGKEAISVMQVVVDKTASAFNEELAQLSFRLDIEQQRLSHVKSVVTNKSVELQRQAGDLLERARLRERFIVKTLHFLLALTIAAIAVAGMLVQGSVSKSILLLVVMAQVVSYATVFSRVEKFFAVFASRWTIGWRSEAGRLNSEARELLLQIANQPVEAKPDPRDEAGTKKPA